MFPDQMLVYVLGYVHTFIDMINISTLHKQSFISLSLFHLVVHTRSLPLQVAIGDLKIVILGCWVIFIYKFFAVLIRSHYFTSIKPLLCCIYLHRCLLKTLDVLLSLLQFMASLTRLVIAPFHFKQNSKHPHSFC